MTDVIQQKELDSGKTVTLFIWETCPHCASARSLFQSIYGDEYEANVNVVSYVITDSSYDVRILTYSFHSVEGREDVRDELKSITGARSVPRIFISTLEVIY